VLIERICCFIDANDEGRLSLPCRRGDIFPALGSAAGTAQSHDALVGCGLTDNHRYNVGREIWSVWQMALTVMLLSAWNFFAV
jgi:hypothetical protein